MKRYLLDTSLLAAYLQSRVIAVQLIHPLIELHGVATSILVYAEVAEYVKGLPMLQNASMISGNCCGRSTRIFSPMPFLSSMQTCEEHCDHLTAKD